MLQKLLNLDMLKKDLKPLKLLKESLNKKKKILKKKKNPLNKLKKTFLKLLKKKEIPKNLRKMLKN